MMVVVEMQVLLNDCGFVEYICDNLVLCLKIVEEVEVKKEVNKQKTLVTKHPKIFTDNKLHWDNNRH